MKKIDLVHFYNKLMTLLDKNLLLYGTICKLFHLWKFCYYSAILWYIIICYCYTHGNTDYILLLTVENNR